MTKNATFKNFEFEKFFTGKVEATGYMCFFYPKKRKKKLKVIFKGVFENKKLKLIEEYFEDDFKTIREWQFEKVDRNKFFGNGKNIVNPFELLIKDNFLEMSYKFKTQFKNFNFNVHIKDHMYVINESTIINYTRISKFLVPIAETQLLYKKL
jgi:hypothetical protein